MKHLFSGGFCIVLLVLTVLAGLPRPANAQQDRRCFEETGLCITGRIREFWEQQGGLPVFGLPITPQMAETIEGQTITVQWFERNRLELHPDLAPPYDVLTGRLGHELLERKQVGWLPDETEVLTTTANDESGSNCRVFPETGHTVCGDILAAWQADGLELDGQPGKTAAESLALFGLPLTQPHEETLSDGNTYTVQWFERARFELHPELAPPDHVLLGLLGSELRRNRSDTFPRFAHAPCPMAVPAGRPVECGYLTVPEHRGQRESRDIQLAVAIFHTTSTTPSPDPVVYLAGGPGGASLPDAASFVQGWEGFLAGRDFVVMDQRGTGFSQPALLCPESAELTKDLLGQDISGADKVAAEINTVLGCRDRLAQQGVNFAGYTSAASAADLEDLRIALGYPPWNLYGISYGTRLALTAMRDKPEGVRSVILDSTYPLQVNLFTDMPDNLNRSLTTLFANCRSTPSCNQSYPDLENVFAEVVGQLERAPVAVFPTHPTTGETVRIHVDGVEMVSLMFRMFYDTSAIPSLPRLISDTHNGNYDLLTSMQQRRLGRIGSDFSYGTYFSVECSEEIAFATPAEVNATRTAYPLLEPFFAGVPENTTEIFRLCEAWGVDPPDPAENQPVSSDIPALLLAGEYDPITPPAWARLAAQTLPQSYVYEFPGTGHAVISRGGCPQRIMRTFLDNPSVAPDGSCAGE